MLDCAGIPDDFFFQPRAGKLRTEAAELYAVPPRAFMDGTAAGFLPFRDVSVGFYTAGTFPLLELAAPVAAFPAGGDPLEIDFIHDETPATNDFHA